MEKNKGARARIGVAAVQAWAGLGWLAREREKVDARCCPQPRAERGGGVLVLVL